MRKNTFLTASFIFFITVTTPLHADASESLSFPDFLNKVQAHYPLLKKQNIRVEEAIIAQHEAAAGFLPKFKGVSSWTIGDDPVYVFGTLLKEGAFMQSDFELSKLNSPDSRSNFSFGVEGRWTLFDAFETISKTQYTGHLAKSEKLTDEFNGMEVSLLAIEAFYRAVLGENCARITTEVLTLSQKDISEAESLNKQGMVLGADFYAAKVNGGMIERMKNRFERDFQSSRVLLNILMGEEPLKDRSLGYEILPASIGNKKLGGWLETAYHSRKDLEALDAVIEAAKGESFRQKMSFLPKISAFGKVEDNTHSLNNASGNYLAGVQGEMDFFDGTYGSRTELARLKLKEAVEDKNTLKDSIAQSLSKEYSVYDTVVADMPVAERMLEDAKNAMDQTEKLYHEGKKSVADLLQIRHVYLETAVKAYETRFYAQTGYSRLLYLSGTLDREASVKFGDGLKKK